MRICDLLLDAMARGLRIGALDTGTEPDVIPRGEYCWIVNISADGGRSYYVSLDSVSSRPGVIECRIKRRFGVNDGERFDPDDLGGSILVESWRMYTATVAAQYFGELCGRKRSGWDGMDEYYPEHGTRGDETYFPPAVINRTRSGGDR
jgi:hypothetical protein